MLKPIAAALLIVGLPTTARLAADNANPPQQSAPAPETPAPAGGEAAAGGGPTETARKAEKGSLKIRYADFARSPKREIHVRRL